LRLLQVRQRQGAGLEPVARGLENHRGMALLKSVSAYEAFRKRHHVALEGRRIAAFLLLDADFPRSVRHNLAVLHGTLESIERLNPGASDEATRQAGWLAARLEYLPGVEAILDTKEPGLETLLEEVASISDAVSSTYFGVKATHEPLEAGGEGAA
jgi:uncharacterized alpha-E superfamily protein